MQVSLVCPCQPNVLSATVALRMLLPEPSGPEKYRQRCRKSLTLITIAGIIFRSELALLLATNTLFQLLTKRIRMRQDVIPAGLIGVVVGLSATVVVDSYFWQQFPLWPEFAAFKFNVLSGQASAWGTEPWHFYFTNALPRLLLNPMTYLIGIPASLFFPSTRRASLAFVVPSLAFVGIYSLQPHKEWRFIIYVIPPLSASAALGAAYIWTRRTKSFLYRILSLIFPLSVVVSFVISTCILLPASAANYPGAHALKMLHVNAHGTQPVIAVHLGNLACQTGVTRFLQLPPPLLHLPGHPDRKLPFLQSGTPTLWTYDKTENATLRSPSAFWDRFDYVLAESEHEIKSRVADPERWAVVDETAGFDGIRVLRPHEKGDGLIETDIIHALGGGEYAVRQYTALRDGIVRRYLTGGYWAEIAMRPKIRTLRHVRDIGREAYGSGTQ
jgi:alpha-1,6-mannosyltransferase